MFGVGRKEYERVLQRCKDLGEEVERYKQRIKDADSEMRKKRLRDMEISTFSCDFEGMRAFAIERNNHRDEVCTIIGYFVSEPAGTTADGKLLMKDVVKEWYLYCSQAQHERLVTSFNEYKKGRA